MSNHRHNHTAELSGQGIANILSPMLGGLPATGAIARTATNIRSGAQSPIAGMIHALTLLCILLFAAPLVSYVPMAALAWLLFMFLFNTGVWSGGLRPFKMILTALLSRLVTLLVILVIPLSLAGLT